VTAAWTLQKADIRCRKVTCLLLVAACLHQPQSARRIRASAVTCGYIRTFKSTLIVQRNGKTRTVLAAVTGALWHGSFKDTPGQLVLVKDPGSGKPYDLALFTLDLAADAAAVIERYSWRWPIEPSNATGKQVLGVGDACNRLKAAVERTVPFGFLVQSLLILWYARSGYDPAGITRRRLLCPWYRTKTEPSAADMLARLRREFLKARFSVIRPGHSPHDQIEDYAWTCDTSAA
jgi:hypothetical protein